MTKEYIVEIKDVYQGPMDLLLQLIKDEKIDIYDIPIEYLADRFIESMDDLSYSTVDLYLDFSLMASSLLEIKSKLILKDEEEEDEEDPREDLVKRLIEYNYYKEVSEILKDYYETGKKYMEKSPEDLTILSKDQTIEYAELDVDALARTLSRMMTRKYYEEKPVDFEISIEKHSVEECNEDIKNVLNRNKEFKFSYLFDNNFSRNHIVTYFLAILELTKMQKTLINQYEKEIVVIKR